MRFNRPPGHPRKELAQREAEDIKDKLERIERAVGGPYVPEEILRFFGSSFNPVGPEIISKLKELAIAGLRGDATNYRDYAANPPNDAMPPMKAVEIGEKLEERADQLAATEFDAPAFFKFLQETIRFRESLVEASRKK